MEELQRFDLTRSMAAYLDLHLVGPLLDFLGEVGLYDARLVAAEKIRAMSRTNMVELVEDEYEKMAADAELAAEFAERRPHLEQRKQEIFALIDNEPAEVIKVARFFEDKEAVEALRSGSELTLDALSSQHGISQGDLEAYLNFGKFKYECGMYEDAEVALGNYLSVGGRSTPPLSALWGRLACRIVQAHWDRAKEDLKVVKLALESRGLSAADQLRQRAWLLHWALFVLLNQRDGMDALADLFADKAYLVALENVCPWMLRYYAVAAVLSPRRRQLLRDVLSEIQVTAYLYSDPVTQFLESLYEHFDFNLAQQRLKECRAVMHNDFFLSVFADRFIDEARALLCEVYCTINRRVDLALLAVKLEVSEEEAERWMLSMVRNTTVALDARIDSAGKQVLMSTPSRSAHQLAVDRTRDLTVRCGVLGSNLEALLQEQSIFLRSRLSS